MTKVTGTEKKTKEREVEMSEDTATRRRKRKPVETEESETFYETGYETQTEKQVIEQQDKDQVRRFWIPPKAEDEKLVCFLDDNPPRLWEHQVAISGSWRNWYTCIRGIGQGACPLCDISAKFKQHTGRKKYGRYYIGVYTILDMVGWIDKEGKERGKNQKQLLVLRIPTMGILKKRRDKQCEGSLVGGVFNVYRSGDKEAASGNDWQFEEKMTQKQMTEKFKDITPLDYRTLFGPKKPQALQDIAEMADGVSPKWFKESSDGEEGGGRKGKSEKSDDEPIDY